MKNLNWVVLTVLIVGLFFGVKTELLAGEGNKGKPPKLLKIGSPPFRVTRVTKDIRDKNPCYSPKSTKIAFLRDKKNGGSGICVMDENGSNLQELPIPPETVDVKCFRWSPKSTEIAFVAGAKGLYGDIWIINADGTNLRNLTNKPGYYSQLCWSPDRTKIAFKNGFKDRVEIWIIDANGKFWYKLTEGSDPVWFPNSKRIALLSKTSPHNYLLSYWAVDINGENLSKLDKFTSPTSLWKLGNPYRSPDGKTIFFKKEGNTFIKSVNGRGYDDFTNSYCSLSPNGEWVLTQQKGSNICKIKSTYTYYYARTDLRPKEIPKEIPKPKRRQPTTSPSRRRPTISRYTSTSPRFSGYRGYTPFSSGIGRTTSSRRTSRSRTSRGTNIRHRSRVSSSSLGTYGYDNWYTRPRIPRYKHVNLHDPESAVLRLLLRNSPNPISLPRLTETRKVRGNSPCWSPDGKKIVFVRDNKIWVMNSDDSNQTQLTF